MKSWQLVLLSSTAMRSCQSDCDLHCAQLWLLAYSAHQGVRFQDLRSMHDDPMRSGMDPPTQQLPPQVRPQRSITTLMPSTSLLAATCAMFDYGCCTKTRPVCINVRLLQCAMLILLLSA